MVQNKERKKETEFSQQTGHGDVCLQEKGDQQEHGNREQAKPWEHSKRAEKSGNFQVVKKKVI